MLGSDDDWEKEYDEEQQQLAAAAAAAVKQAASTPSLNKTASKKAAVEYAPIRTNLKVRTDDEPLEDPVLERLRRKKLDEEAEQQLFQDLIEGVGEEDQDIVREVPLLYHIPFKVREALSLAQKESAKKKSVTPTHQGPSLSTFEFKTIKDCEQFIDAISKNIVSSSAKSVVWRELISKLIELVAPKMIERDIKTLAKKLENSAVKRTVEKTVSAQEKRKANETTRQQLRNHKDEYDLVYGDREVDSFDEEED